MPGRHRKPPRPRTPGRHRKPPQRSRWGAPVLVGVIALGLGGAGAAAAFTGGDASAGHQPLAAHAARPMQPSSSTPSSSAPTSLAPAPASGVASRPAGATAASDVRHIGFALSVTGRVAWVEIGVPGRRPIFQGLLRHGRTLRTHARPLRVVVGDAGAVRLVLHARVHAPLGRSGEVLVFTVAR